MKSTVLSHRQELADAQKILAVLKLGKLMQREHKHIGEGEWDFRAVLDHLKEELREFEGSGDRANSLIELADISNIVDILAMMELERRIGE